MNLESYYYNCSQEYINSIDAGLQDEITGSIALLPKRQKQSEINADLFWLLTSKNWYYDTVPTGWSKKPPDEFGVTRSLQEIRQWNTMNLCRTSTTLNTKWHADFAKLYGSSLVQVEAQFGKAEAMFKDFCGFRIAYAEKRLALGILIVLSDPMLYFAHRKSAISGMASFNVAKDTLNVIGLDVPIWLVGVGE
ncbi:MAG: hypothetical protein DRQ58_08810 [Gammaproteobacteria bacterium]|nr:MAG: hypothetical protein DRQ58_08810 [Gammaproteobacteria bacterium]